jgi:hypothetical protein
MTTIERVTRNGQSGIKVTCSCATHTADANSAIILGPAWIALGNRTGKNRDERVHGFVTLANHPAAMIRRSNERNGIFAA